MLTFIVGLLLASILFLSISLQKTYHHVPKRELKRQAKQGDEVSKLFYRVVSYDMSLDMLLWAITGIAAGVFFVFLSKNLPWPVAVFGCVACIWFGFAWLPGSHITRPGFLLAKFVARPLAGLLEWLHSPLVHFAQTIDRFRPITVHTGLYTREDVIEFLDQQRAQIDNRVSKRDLDLITHSLQVGEKKVSDIMTPWRKVKKIATHDMVGPIVMDELHKSGHTHFPVYQGGDKNDIVGILNIADMLDAKAGGFVKDVMVKRVYFLHEDEKVADAFATIAKTKHPLFLVINNKGDIVGVVSMSEAILHMLGDLPHSDFTAHDSRTAVAAKKRKNTSQTEETVVESDTTDNKEKEASESSK